MYEEQSISVGEAARQLGVGVSTLKRWADSGKIDSFRTLGGHRRFTGRALGRFRARRESAGSFEADWLDLLCNENDSNAVAAELLRLRASAGAWCLAADQLGTVMDELGKRWASGAITVLQEHLASQRLSRACSLCAQTLPVSPAAPRALLATAEGDEHTLGLALAELVFREAGWEPLWAGRSTPVSSLVEAIKQKAVDLVALSASSASQDAETLARNYLALELSARDADVELVLGGEGAWPDDLPHGHRFHAFADLSRLLREMAGR